jgi:hypothetical protein
MKHHVDQLVFVFSRLKRRIGREQEADDDSVRVILSDLLIERLRERAG